MLKDAPLMVSFSVDDLDRAKQFYHDTLGLEIDDSMSGMLLLKVPSDGVQVGIYAKPTHTPATYTVLNFTVNDLEATMRQLEERGVVFERYDQEDIKTDERGVVDYGVMKIAFFNDPAGNNHAVFQMTNAA